VGVHAEDIFVVASGEDSGTDSLQAGRVFVSGVNGGHPGDGLGAPGVEASEQFVNKALHLVDGAEGATFPRIGEVADDVVSEKTLMIGIAPLLIEGIDPGIVHTVDDFLPVDFEFFQAGGEASMKAGLRHGGLDDHEGGGIAAGWS